MDIRETQSDYGRLGHELRSLIQGFDPSKHPSTLKAHFDRVLELAAKIGAPLEEDAEALKKAFALFLKHPKDERHADHFRKLALRLEQETREL